MRTPEELRAKLAEGADVSKDGLRELILMAEDQQFTPEQGLLVSALLLDYALQNRKSLDPADAPAVFSAIRTGASMLRPHEANRLIPLLAPGFPIDTVIETLKMLGRIFEAQPPDGPDQHKLIAGLIWLPTVWFLNHWSEDQPPRIAATIQLAVYALVAMKSSHAEGMINAIGRTCPKWLVQQMDRELAGLKGDEVSSNVEKPRA